MIYPDIPEGQHVPITCDKHPHLRWSTKNIGIGQRNIFFVGDSTRPGYRPWPGAYVVGRMYVDFDGNEFEMTQEFKDNDEWRIMSEHGFVFECDCPLRFMRRLRPDERKGEAQ